MNESSTNLALAVLDLAEAMATESRAETLQVMRCTFLDEATALQLLFQSRGKALAAQRIVHLIKEQLP